MKILFITNSFNSMCQRAWIELDKLDHQVKIHIADNGINMIAAVNAFRPDLIVAPYLSTKIPDAVWKKYTCFIVHPGPPGDRGSSSLDWAILNNVSTWGVTILQATEKMDAGPVWASASFSMKNAAKSFLYRHQVTQAAMQAMLEAVQKFSDGDLPGEMNEGVLKRSTGEADFSFSWNETTASIIRKINAADSAPGALCTVGNKQYYAFGVVKEELLSGHPSQIVAKNNEAVCIATGDGAVWLRCLKEKKNGAIKLPAVMVLSNLVNNFPDVSSDIFENKTTGFHEVWYQENNCVGYLHFNFYNGAMSAEQCRRLLRALRQAKQRNTKVIVLMGGEDFWSNGIHLNVIEASENPAQTSWENILALNDLIKEIVCTESHYIVSALQGNAGAGGVALALAADKVVAKKGIVFNPHTQTMGLYGSEYWTYLLPRRIGTEKAHLFTTQCIPWGTDIALQVKLIDDCFDGSPEIFWERVKQTAEQIASLSYFPKLLSSKIFKRRRDEAFKPLDKYRQEELEKMQRNFFEDDQGFHWKRHCFVHKLNPHHIDITSRELFSERRKIWRRRKYEKMYYEL